MLGLIQGKTIRLGMTVLAALVTITISKSQAQITFTKAFPGVTFAGPVYFGVHPGKAQTYVVLEQHKGNVILVSQKGSTWVKDTMYTVKVSQNGEMGLLGIAFHPDFVHNHRYFISYDPPSGSANVLEERLADASMLKDSGTPGIELINITDKYSNHNGGTIGFGPKDGYLYFGTGDGGSGGDPDGNGQNKDVLLAKMLRIDVDKKEGSLNYGIPSDNPFVTSGGRKEIFAYGLRNPWKWSFDPVTAKLWVGDVGQDKIEEVDTVSLGGNYGWKTMEGPSGTNNGGMTLPVFSYTRTDGNCVIGGVVFRGASGSKYYGTYFVADYTSKIMWNLKLNGAAPATATEVESTPAIISSFGTDELGRIYLCGVSDGTIYRMDGPDLTGGTPLRSRADLSAWPHRQVFHVAKGERLAPEVFSSAESLEVFSVEGVKIGSLSRQSPLLSKPMKTGMYLLRNPVSRQLPDLLIVR